VAFKAHVDSLFDTVDVLLCPSAPGEAPKGQEFTGDPRFNSIWTLAGTPCVTLPAGKGAKGLPLGLQLVGQRHADDQSALHRRVGRGPSRLRSRHAYDQR
jgi:amidase